MSRITFGLVKTLRAPRTPPPLRSPWQLRQETLPALLQTRRFFGWSSNSGDDGKKGDTPVTESESVSESSGREETERQNGRKSRNRTAATAQEDAIVPLKQEGAGQLRKDSSGFEPLSLALPMFRRPLFPLQQQLVQVTSPKIVKELMSLAEKRQVTNVSFFLHKNGGSQIAEPKDGEEELLPSAKLEELTDEDPMEILHSVGTQARIVQAMPIWSPKNGDIVALQMIVAGTRVVTLEKVLQQGPPLQVQIGEVAQEAWDNKDEMLKATMNETMQTVKDVMKVSSSFREHAGVLQQTFERMTRLEPETVAHLAASLTTAEGEELQKVLEATNPMEKLRHSLELLKKELELAKLQQKISNQIEEKMSKNQREFMLREQLKSIKKELGIDKDDGSETILQKFKERLEGKEVPKDAKEAIDSEFEKFANLAKESQEYQMTRNYLDWLTSMPYSVYSKDTFDLKKAREILDRDHYGLADIKDRIREFIAVGVLRGSMQGKILCFVGPPGVGKTSIGKSIAEALGREFYRFSVGGLYDVAEIKGHRRTYVGAMPGKIIQCLKKTQTSNPLVLIDEVDKIGRGHHGDPSSALLELLDPSQNSAFMDHYLDVPVDCSNILFLCTANVLDTIPGPLLDRMEVIRLTGYDLQEKMKIAEDYLVPSAMVEVGLKQKEEKTEKTTEATTETETSEAAELSSSVATSEATPEPKSPTSPTPEEKPEVKAVIEATAIESLIRWYCREAGVRNLQKHIERICRKLATKVVEQWENRKALTGTDSNQETNTSKEVLELRVDEAALSEYVGKPVFTSDRLYEGQLPSGTVTGLAWTAMGGSVLYIEATALPRARRGDAAAATSAPAVPPSLAVTGQLGSVMKESSQIALLVARRQLQARGKSGFFEEHELFLHCPEGATPKDGPSAGVTMTTALLSLAMEMPIPTDLAMTGEVSLNGKVLAVGGIKEKTIAARRAGCKTLIFPEANRRDYDELPKYLQDGLTVHFATHFDEVFNVAFGEQTDANKPNDI